MLESVQGDKLRLKKKDWVNIFEEDFNGMSLDFNVGTEKRPMVGTLEKMKRQAGIDVGGRVDAAVEVDTDTDEQSNGSADSSIKLGLRQISDTDNLKKMTRQVDVKGEIVHCSDDSFNGLIVIGCTPVDLSPEKRSRMEKAERVKRRAGIDVGVNLPVPADVDPTLEEFELRKRTTTVQMCCMHYSLPQRRLELTYVQYRRRWNPMSSPQGLQRSILLGMFSFSLLYLSLSSPLSAPSSLTLYPADQ